MVVFWVGTIAELIKLFPIMQDLERKNRKFLIVSTGQNDLSRSDLMELINTPISLKLSSPPARQNAIGLILWFINTSLGAYFKLRRLVGNAEVGKVLVVHGDTVSTLMGAVLGKMLGFRVAHVEAGLRSFKLLSPFPEEICRRLVSNFVNVHFCPDQWSVSNLSRHRGLKLCTNGNTLIDSLKYARSVPYHSKVSVRLQDKRYFVFVIHRQENLFNEALLKRLYQRVATAVEGNLTCFMLLHEPARVALIRLGLMAKFEALNNLVISPRLGYIEFMKILAGAEFVVTDGGSNQEECFYLGRPCLILRKATERMEGLGENVLLSKCSDEIIDHFFSNPSRYSRLAKIYKNSPSEVVVDYLISNK